MRRSSRTTSSSAAAAGAPDPPEPRLSPAAREALLALACAAVRAAARRAPPPSPPAELPAGLDTPAGAFVSLHAGGALRGCLGHLEPADPLAAVVVRMAGAVATRDPRFPPLEPADLRGLRVEVSVLSPLRRVGPDAVDPRRHGVVLRLGERSGVLLPQVAARHGWDRATFLAQLCAKAGLAADAWRDPTAALWIFTVLTLGRALGPREASPAR